MGKLISSTTMTVDGVTDVADWYVSEGEHDAAAREVFEHVEAMVLGRKTYVGLAEYWSATSGPWADLLNPMPKFVASRTLSEPLTWNASLLEGDAADGVAELKEKLDGDAMLIGCGELARHLAANGLIDEIRFWVHPALWGQGARPFEGETIRMQLLDVTSFDSGVALFRYEPLAD